MLKNHFKAVALPAKAALKVIPKSVKYGMGGVLVLIVVLIIYSQANK